MEPYYIIASRRPTTVMKMHHRHEASTLQKSPPSWRCSQVFPSAFSTVRTFLELWEGFQHWNMCMLRTDLKTSVNCALSICRGFLLWPIYVPPMKGCKDIKCGGLCPTHALPPSFP